MAGNPDPFANFPLDTSGIDPHDIKQNPHAALNGLSDFQRFITKNLFDTQTERRREFLRQNGFEMSEDGEGYRPLGSKAEFQPIDPDNRFLGFIPAYNVFTPEGWKEIVKDLGDIAFEMTAETALIGAGQLAGAAGIGAVGATSGAIAGGATGAGIPGAAVGAVLGGGAGAIAGGGVGAAGGKVASEKLKEALGNLFLDKDIPLDQKELAYQSLTAGLMSQIVKLGGPALQKMIKKWRLAKVKDTEAAMKRITVQKSNGKFNNELVDDFARNPDRYTPDNVQGATKRLLEIRDEIFGTSVDQPSTLRQIRGGVAGKAMSKLNKKADLEIERLSLDPRVNFTVDEIENIIKRRMEPLSKKSFPEPQEVQALKYFQGRLKALRKGAQTEKGAFRELNFKEGRDFLKQMQNAAFKEGQVKDNGFVKDAAAGLKQLADAKAGELGSDLPSINASRSEILNFYNAMRRKVTDGTIQNAYVGNDSVSKQRVIETFQRMDELLLPHMDEAARDEIGGSFEGLIKSEQFKSAVERLYKEPRAFGSGSVFRDVLREGLREGVKGGFAGGSAGAAIGAPVTGAKIGFGLGFTQGARRGAALSTPERLPQQFSKIRTRIDDIEAGRILPKPVTDFTGKLIDPLTGFVPEPAKQVGRIAGEIVRGGAPAALGPENVFQEPPAEGPVATAQVPPPDKQPEEEDPFANFKLDLTGTGLE